MIDYSKPWTRSGREITTPTGTFYLTYFTDKTTGAARFPDFCQLDDIAKALAALPDIRFAIRATLLQLTQGKVLARDDCATQLRAALAVIEGRP